MKKIASNNFAQYLIAKFASLKSIRSLRFNGHYLCIKIKEGVRASAEKQTLCNFFDNVDVTNIDEDFFLVEWYYVPDELNKKRANEKGIITNRDKARNTGAEKQAVKRDGL